MPKVYKPIKRNKKKARTIPPGWGHLAIGVAIGLAIGAAVYFYKTRFSQHSPPQAAIQPQVVKKPPATADKPQQPTKSQYDFYTLLPEMEVVIPERDEPSDANHHARADKKEVYVLQAGSFRRFEEADTLKASLALIGIQATIQSVAINGEDTWYRVRIGPYSDFSQLRQARSQLRKNDIEYIVLKIRLDNDG
jgi:cell division protein FtsN